MTIIVNTSIEENDLHYLVGNIKAYHSQNLKKIDVAKAKGKDAKITTVSTILRSVDRLLFFTKTLYRNAENGKIKIAWEIVNPHDIVQLVALLKDSEKYWLSRQHKDGRQASARLSAAFEPAWSDAVIELGREQ